MKCRKNLRALFAQYNSAAPAEKPNTALMKLKNAILALRNPALHPSQLIARADVAADIANDVALGMLGPGATLASRYDDFVWAHHQVMMLGPNDPSGPNYAHRGPAFGPWHRELLRLFELELQQAAGDPALTLPYWDWTHDRSLADPGFPFTAEFLGGDGAGQPQDRVVTGDFAAQPLRCDEEGFGFLRRHFGGDGPGLPTAAQVRAALNVGTYDASPWNWSAASAGSFRNTLEGWVGAGQIHNAVHRWVDGSMQPGTSPNDPVFFLHHCNIDRLWAVWEQKHPGSAPYLPGAGTPAATGLTRLDDLMSTFGRTASDRYFGVDTAPSGVVQSKAIQWYDSDLPELTNETGGTLSFVDVPEGLTTYKAVKFRIQGCRPVHLRITGAPTGAFGLTPMGSEFVADPDEADFYYGYVWIQFTAAAGPVAGSSLDIHAYIVDQEGYFAATEGGEFPLGDFHFNVTATTVPRQNNAVALVLDRSGSMATPAGGGSTKSGLLKNAVSVFNTLMLPSDEIALVSFDDLVAVPAPMQPVSANAVPPAVAGNALDPRGLTCIGGGILEGANQLGAATHANRSMVVLTDGIENVHPYVGELPAGTITHRTYAIGFGLPADVSTPVLQQITSNTHGDLIITGNLDTAEQNFHLTKYFVQVLAGVTNMNVVLDPQGMLFLGSRQVVPFQLTASDVYVDVIALCPLPQLLDFTLETPSGQLIKASGGGANVGFVLGPQVAFYRITLPALAADPAGSHAGQWKAILALKDKRTLDKLLRNRELAGAAEMLRQGALPYSLVVHAYSNLRFDARLEQDSLAPGAKVNLRAALKAYDVPLATPASVWAEVTDPAGNLRQLALDRVAAGDYAASFVAAEPGVYACRIRAEGYDPSHGKFTREKSLTAAVYRGGDKTPDGSRDRLCELLRCLVCDEVIGPRGVERLHALGIDIKGLRHCLDELCPPPPREERPGAKPPMSKRTKIPLQAERPAKPLPQPKPVRAKAPPAGKPAAVTFPRVIHMFTPPQELAGHDHAMAGHEPKAGRKPHAKKAGKPPRKR